MTNLSPAALAVWEAFNSEEPGVFVDYGDCLAAALRAAVAHTQQHRGLGVWECDVDELLSLAAELDNNSTH